MIGNIFKKGLVIGIIFLFIGTSFISVTSINLNNSETRPKLIPSYKYPIFPHEGIPKLNFIYNIGQSVQQTSDNGYIVTGFKGDIDLVDPDSETNLNILLIKYDENGNQEWNKIFELMEATIGNSVLQTDDLGYIIGGSIASPEKPYAMLLKTDEQGNEEWVKTYEGLGISHGTDVQKTNDNGYVITGSTSPLENRNISHILLVKTDGQGNEEWNKTFEFINISTGNSVQQTEDLGYIICGYIISADELDSNIKIIKTDENGNEEWNKTFEFMELNIGYSVQQTDDKGYIIGGYMVASNNLKPYALLLKLDENGNEEWHQSYIRKYGYFAQQTEDNGYIIGGTAISQFTYHALLIKTDGNGNEEWSNTYQGMGYAQGTMVQQTSDNGYIMTGTTIGAVYSMKTYVLLIKTDEDGNLQWINNVTKNSPVTKSLYSIIFNLLENLKTFLENF